MAIIEKEMIWRQFGASIDMFGEALRDCPDAFWETRLWPDLPDQWGAAGFSKFWYIGYHVLFWLDLYLTGSEEGFAPPPPFSLVEMEEELVLPRTYTRAELLDYLSQCRRKCHDTILQMDEAQASRLCRFGWGEVTFAELLLYNMRHVQEHSAQLHMFLGQQAGRYSDWTPTARPGGE